MAGTSGEGIYAKAPSRKGAKKEEEMNMTENEIAKIFVDVVYIEPPARLSKSLADRKWGTLTSANLP